MPQMAPYNWSLYLTLVMMFLFSIIIINFFSNTYSLKKKNFFKKKNTSIDWKW